MRLADLQRRMAGAVLNGDVGAMPRAVPAPVPADAAFGVHRDTVMGALTHALRLTYPTVDTLVGPAFFDHIAATFVAQRPPRRARLSDYGDGFADVLEAEPSAAMLPYLSDVARLDLAVARALTAPGADVRRHIAIDAQAAMALPVSLTTLDVSYPADLIRAEIEAGDDSALAAIDLAPAPRCIAVWRADRHAVVRRLGPPAGLFLARILSGESAHQALAAVFAETSAPDALAAIQAEVFAAPFCRVTQTHLKEPIP